MWKAEKNYILPISQIDDEVSSLMEEVTELKIWAGQKALEPEPKSFLKACFSGDPLGTNQRESIRQAKADSKQRAGIEGWAKVG